MSRCNSLYFAANFDWILWQVRFCESDSVARGATLSGGCERLTHKDVDALLGDLVNGWAICRPLACSKRWHSVMISSMLELFLAPEN